MSEPNIEAERAAAIRSDVMSNCCSAKVYMPSDWAICMKCQEYCEVIKEDEEKDTQV